VLDAFVTSPLDHIPIGYELDEADEELRLDIEKLRETRAQVERAIATTTTPISPVAPSLPAVAERFSSSPPKSFGTPLASKVVVVQDVGELGLPAYQTRTAEETGFPPRGAHAVQDGSSSATAGKEDEAFAVDARVSNQVGIPNTTAIVTTASAAESVLDGAYFDLEETMRAAVEFMDHHNREVCKLVLSHSSLTQRKKKKRRKKKGPKKKKTKDEKLIFSFSIMQLQEEVMAIRKSYDELAAEHAKALKVP
jgi:hypothetical protein